MSWPVQLIIYKSWTTGESFFNPQRPDWWTFRRMPMLFWLRYGTAVDHGANPPDERPFKVPCYREEPE